VERSHHDVQIEMMRRAVDDEITLAQRSAKMGWFEEVDDQRPRAMAQFSGKGADACAIAVGDNDAVIFRGAQPVPRDHLTDGSGGAENNNRFSF
jgi:hypothetical protein